MTTEARQPLLDRIQADWRPFREAVERLGPEGMERRTAAGWTLKEMIAHVALSVRLEA